MSRRWKEVAVAWFVNRDRWVDRPGDVNWNNRITLLICDRLVVVRCR